MSPFGNLPLHMRGHAPATTALLALVVAFTGAQAGDTHSPEEIATARREIVQSYFEADATAARHAAEARDSCFLGKEPGNVVRSRAGGWYFEPDAADTCIAVLTRLARDGQFDVPYRELVDAIGGDDGIIPGLPSAIGAAAMSNRQLVNIGHDKGAKLRPSMALDAGFTVAYQTGAAVPGGKPDFDKVKSATEACLADQQDLATCYTVGFMQGAQTVHH